MKWKVGAAKQKLSEVLRRSCDEPQLVYSRDRLVAAVISAELFEEFDRWHSVRRQRTLADGFDEIREICREEDYRLDTGQREDRESWISDHG